MDNTTFKIITLWAMFLFGLVFHSLLSSLPQFYGVNITLPDANGSVPAFINWVSLAFYLIPMLCITLTLFLASKITRIFNLIAALLLTVASFMHVLEEVGVNNVQVVLLGFIFVLTVLLSLTSWRWVKGVRAS